MLLELATRAARRKLEWGVLPSTKAMWRTRISTTELAFLVCGLLIIFVGWTADFLGVFEFASSPGGHGSGTTFPLRLFMTMFWCLLRDDWRRLRELPADPARW